MKQKPGDEEHHEFQFAGVWVPPHILEMVRDHVLSGADFLVYNIIHALQGKDGCYASNEYLARACSVSNTRTVRRHINKLKELGLVKQTGFDGRHRFIKVVYPDGATPTDSGGTSEGAELAQAEGAETTPQKSSLKRTLKKEEKKKRQSGAVAPDGVVIKKGRVRKDVVGFGLGNTPPEDETYNNTNFDEEMAATLEEAVRGYNMPRRTGITRAKPSTWPAQFYLLRTRDEVPEDDIRRVLKWYTTNIGEPFVPEAFSGTAFRKKFATIEERCNRDTMFEIEIGEDAKKLAARLTPMGWPRGAAADLPGAIQMSLTAYENWLAARNTFIKRLHQGRVTIDPKMLKPFISLAKHLTNLTEPPTFFIRKWFEWVHRKVVTWQDWDGGFTPFVFRPTSKRFRAIGRGWLHNYCRDIDRWDKFNAVILEEVGCE